MHDDVDYFAASYDVRSFVNAHQSLQRPSFMQGLCGFSDAPHGP
jgi:hypothetical protein